MTEALGRVTPDAAGRAAVVAWMREFSEFYDGFAPVFTGFSVAVRSDRALAGASAPVSAGFGQALRPHLVLDDGAVRARGDGQHHRHDDRAGQPAADRQRRAGRPQALRRGPRGDRAPRAGGARSPGLDDAGGRAAGRHARPACGRRSPTCRRRPGGRSARRASGCGPGSSRPGSRCSRSSGSTRPGSTTSSPRPGPRTAASTATSRARTTCSGSSPPRRRRS